MPATVPTAVIAAWGRPPEVHDMPAPTRRPGHALVRLEAAAVNPVDVAIGAGRFYLPLPEPPFTAGVEAVGEVLESDAHAPGTRVWCLRADAGCWSGVFAAPDDRLVPVARDADPVTAAAMGVAGLAGWMPVVTRGRLAVGETVLVMGATGAVGQVAVQAARARGAGRVVGVGRDAERLERVRALGADDVVAVGDVADLGERVAAACPERVNLVIDALWGEPLAAVVSSLAHGARVVHVGAAAGQVCPLPGGPLRGGRVDVRGFSLFSEPFQQVGAAHADLVRLATEGGVSLRADTVPLADVASAWQAQGTGAGGRKLVLVP